MAFVRPTADVQTCPYCNAPRYLTLEAREQKWYTYWPLANRFALMFLSQLAKNLTVYSAKFHSKAPSDIITDFFDGELYSMLRGDGFFQRYLLSP